MVGGTSKLILDSRQGHCRGKGWMVLPAKRMSSMLAMSIASDSKGQGCNKQQGIILTTSASGAGMHAFPVGFAAVLKAPAHGNFWHYAL